MYFQRFKCFNNIFFIKFKIFKVNNYIIINEYDIKFKNLVNKLFIYSRKFKVNIN